MSDGANAAGEEYKVLCIGLGRGKGRRQYRCALAFGIATRMKERISAWLSKVTLHETSAGSGEIGDVHYRYTRATTCTSIRRHANQENEKQDPKSRRQMKLFNVGVFILLVPLSVCVPMFYMYTHICVCERIRAWFTNLRTQRLFSDLMWSRNLGVAVLRRFLGSW